MNAVGYGAFDVGKYTATDHKTLCRFIQIEHIEAVRNLEEIMQNEFIDGYIIGANDLSGSIHELLNVFGENTTTLVRETITKLENSGKYVGLAMGAASESTLRHWADMGVDMLTAGADFSFLTEEMKANKEIMSRVLSERGLGENENI